jgi:dTMP kinase
VCPDTTELARGFLFVMEGIDGAGKTAVCDRVWVLLEKDSYSVVRLHEPTSESRWGREIRERSRRGELSPSEELELFMHDREWHVKKRIRPALRSKKLVLMDRYFFASAAYQSTSTGLHWSEILRMNREGISAPEPDVVFLLDISAEEGLSRVCARTGETNIQFERVERLLRVREAYLDMAQRDKGNYHIVDATRPLDSVVDEVHSSIRRYMEGHE